MVGRMEKNKFYKLDINKAKGFLFEEELLKEMKDKFFVIIDVKKVNDFYVVKLTEVYAVLVDRIIFRNEYEFIVEDIKRFFECFIEVSLKDVRDSIDNTQALLSKKIFRR